MIEASLLVFIAFTFLAALLAAIAIRTPRSTAIRVFAVATTAVFIPVSYVGLNEILARPKSMTHEWLNSSTTQATVLGVSLDEGKAIYLWLRLDSSPEPRYYRLPWLQKNAEKLQSALGKAAEEDDAVVRMRNPFSRESWTSQGEINLEIVRPAVPPLKTPRPPPQIFDPRERRVHVPDAPGYPA